MLKCRTDIHYSSSHAMTGIKKNIEDSPVNRHLSAGELFEIIRTCVLSFFFVVTQIKKNCTFLGEVFFGDVIDLNKHPSIFFKD